MRAYFFGNMYLSSIQQGIQAAHAVSEMFIRFPIQDLAVQRVPGDLILNWAQNHKTMILLNGGYAATIQDLVDFFDKQSMHDTVEYPWAPFYEEQDSLNGALTTVGIILPEKIYLIAAEIRSERASFEGQRLIREMIWEDGEITIGPENTIGFDVSKDLVLSYTKWEAQLIDRLNQFTTMAI